MFSAAAAGTSVEVSHFTDQMPHLCLQGPASRSILQGLTDTDLSNAAFPYYSFKEGVRVAGIPVFMTRLGYTAELGYELWVGEERKEIIPARLFGFGIIASVVGCAFSGAVWLALTASAPVSRARWFAVCSG